jgi:hypothetical protein
MAMSPRLLRPVATGFDPRRISGLLAWYDPQVSSSYTTATGVSEWRDLSGNGHTLTQSTPNNQPALSTINGKTAFAFDGSNDEMIASSVVLGATSADSFSFLGVAQSANSTSGYVIGHASASLVGFAVVSGLVTNSYDLRYGNGAPVASVAKANDIAEVWSVTHVGAAGAGTKTARWAINGSLQAELTNVNVGNAATENLRVGNRPGGTSSATYFIGKIGSLLIYNRALSLAERSRLERWLGQRWGITVA